MIYKFEHAITVSEGAYDRIVARAANPPDAIPDELKPWNFDTHTGKNRVAGGIMVATATPDEFTGSWYIDDGPTTGKNAAYVDMLRQIGLPKRAEFFSLAFDQHLVAGSRVEDNIFSVTSLFRCSVKDGRGRKTSAKTLEKRQQQEDEMMRLVPAQSLYREDFDYRAFMRVARGIPTKYRIY